VSALVQGGMVADIIAAMGSIDPGDGRGEQVTRRHS
jgi:hypothetical protein